MTQYFKNILSLLREASEALEALEEIIAEKLEAIREAVGDEEEVD